MTGRRFAIPRLRSRLVDLGYAAGWALIRAVPHRLAAAVSRLVAGLAARRNGKGVRRLRSNLRRVVGPAMSEPDLDALTRRAVHSYARYWLEVFRLSAMNAVDVVRRADAHTEGAEHIDEAIAAGRGAIVALPHSGNWEVAAIWLIDRGYPFTTVAERLQPESLYRRFVSFRESLGMEVLPLTGGARPPSEVLAERLRADRVICLLGDRDLTRSGVEVSFFGQTAKMPAGPALLAATTGAALLPVGLWFEGRDWGQRIHPPVPVPAEGRLRDRVQAATQAMADCFAADISARPEDWHMLHRLWVADLAPRQDDLSAQQDMVEEPAVGASPNGAHPAGPAGCAGSTGRGSSIGSASSAGSVAGGIDPEAEG
jgi:phosphatidylinositol dimannoside acyltransferase